MKPAIATYPLLTLASGDVLSLQVYTFRGARSGRTVYLQANLHGAELAGNAVIDELITWLQGLNRQALCGEIRLVPVCNPLGVNARAHQYASGRYNSYDGRDWNRIFWDYTQFADDLSDFVAQNLKADIPVIQRRYRTCILETFQQQLEALEAATGTPTYQRYRTRLQAQALDADTVIDLHSSSNQGLMYLYYFRDRAHWIADFAPDFAVLLDQFDGNAFDEAFLQPWLALEAAFAEQQRSLTFDVDAWTLELGSGMALSPAAVSWGVKGILNYLRHRGVLCDQPPLTTGQPPLLTRASQIAKYYAPQGGLVQRRVEPGTWVQSGEPLYELLAFNKSGTLPTAIAVSAQGSGLVYDVSWNQAVNEGEYVLAMVAPDSDSAAVP